jgi:small multidrug resistance pump
LFIVNLGLQLLALTMLPMSQGFTKPVPVIVLMISLLGAMWCLSRLIVSGVGLGFLFPLLGAAIPLAAMILGAFVFGEAFSVPKAAVLTLACGLIGLSSVV